jgi:hypothetical protein
MTSYTNLSKSPNCKMIVFGESHRQEGFRALLHIASIFLQVWVLIEMMEKKNSFFFFFVNQ